MIEKGTLLALIDDAVRRGFTVKIFENYNYVDFFAGNYEISYLLDEREIKMKKEEAPANYELYIEELEESIKHDSNVLEFAKKLQEANKSGN